MIQLDLSANYAEALLHHARTYKPKSSDPRNDMRLQDALDDLAVAIERHLLGHFSPNQELQCQ